MRWSDMKALIRRAALGPVSLSSEELGDVCGCDPLMAELAGAVPDEVRDQLAHAGLEIYRYAKNEWFAELIK